MNVLKQINFGINDIADRMADYFNLNRSIAKDLATTLCSEVAFALTVKSHYRLRWDYLNGEAYAPAKTSNRDVIKIIENELSNQLDKIAHEREEQ